jgi:exodeoxyribonuclease V alpha subunit
MAGPFRVMNRPQAILAGYAGYLDALRADGRNVGAATDAFARFRTLCAVRDGARGVEAINRLVSKHFRSALKHPLDPGEHSEWYPGRPVMVLRNDYVLKLFNGDIGIVMPDDSGALMVFFPEGDAGFRAVAPVRLPAHETAFAMTVHKSQGSEFDQVLVLLPADHNPVLTRELVYTAVTRARLRVTLVSGCRRPGESHTDTDTSPLRPARTVRRIYSNRTVIQSGALIRWATS